ncbi:MAG: hypothetical protein ACE5HV_16865 [Acidobacteriota bacterium]
MKARLNALEQRMVHDLLTWDRTRRTADLIACKAALALGGVVAVLSGGFTVAHWQEGAILWRMLPGLFGGVFLFFLYIIGEAHVRDRHRLATILQKLVRE